MSRIHARNRAGNASQLRSAIGASCGRLLSRPISMQATVEHRQRWHQTLPQKINRRSRTIAATVRFLRSAQPMSNRIRHNVEFVSRASLPDDSGSDGGSNNGDDRPFASSLPSSSANSRTIPTIQRRNSLGAHSASEHGNQAGALSADSLMDATITAPHHEQKSDHFVPLQPARPASRLAAHVEFSNDTPLNGYQEEPCSALAHGVR
jgi:hypothetical protein